jgi:hypothetical protein
MAWDRRRLCGSGFKLEMGSSSAGWYGVVEGVNVGSSDPGDGLRRAEVELRRCADTVHSTEVHIYIGRIITISCL